jgi:hypothetical protein
MLKKLKLAVAVAAFAAAGCAMPNAPMDAAVVQSQFGVPVTTPFTGDPVTGRNWNCRCHCKSCYQ